MKIILDLKDLHKPSNAKYGWAYICIKIGDKFYPDLHWNDKIFSVLSDWMYNIINRNSNEYLILNFIDGEHAIKLIKNKDEFYSAYFGYWDSFDEVFVPKDEKINDKINIDKFYLDIIEINKELIQFVNYHKIKYPYLRHFIKMSEDFKIHYHFISS